MNLATTFPKWVPSWLSFLMLLRHLLPNKNLFCHELPNWAKLGQGEEFGTCLPKIWLLLPIFSHHFPLDSANMLHLAYYGTPATELPFSTTFLHFQPFCSPPHPPFIFCPSPPFHSIPHTLSFSSLCLFILFPASLHSSLQFLYILCKYKSLWVEWINTFISALFASHIYLTTMSWKKSMSQWQTCFSIMSRPAQYALHSLTITPLWDFK